MAVTMQFEGIWKGIQGTKFCVNRVFWASEVDVPSAQPSHLTAALYDVWTNYQRALMHPAYRLLEFIGQFSRTGSGVVQSHTYGVNEPGTYSTTQGAMAPHDTILTWKVPDNSTIEPAGAQVFKNGKISWAGVPEESQEDGVVVGSDLNAWNTFAEQLETLTLDPGGANYTIDLAMLRRENTLSAPNPRAYVYVLETTTAQTIGTQVRRKR